MHKLLLNFIFSLLILGVTESYVAQNIPIGTWQDHLSYKNSVSITQHESKIYCATKSALFIYDNSDESLTRLSSVNGLSDVDINKVRFIPNVNSLLIVYENGNIDIIDGQNDIYNISSIKNSNIIGNKAINNIYVHENLAYLATGFGIVVLDLNRSEIKETYLIGSLGTYVNVNAITMDSTKVYAATDDGVYAANKNSSNLIDYNNWGKLPQFNSEMYSNIVYYNKMLFLSSESDTWKGDTVYYSPNGNWEKFYSEGKNITNINISKSNLFISENSGLEMYNKQLNLIKNIYTYQGLYAIRPQEVIINDDGYIYIAEESRGIIKAKDNWNLEIIAPNSPSSSNTLGMDLIDDELWLTSGGYGLSLNKNLVNHKTNTHWYDLGSNILDNNGETAKDMVNVAINPNNTSQVFVGSWSSGLYEYNNNQITNIYTGQNSALDSVFFGITAISGMAFDNNYNFWVSSSYSATYPLAVKTPDNNWYNYSLLGLTSSQDYYTQILVDNNNYKWIISPNKIIVFDDNNTLDNKNDDRAVANSNIPGTDVLCLAEDQDGEIWVGTDEGIGVFYNPSDVFDSNIEAEQILIQQDGQTQILLETESITAIAIDGANRKWLGTKSSGVYLMSPDGTEEVEHFTTENSPLFSNTVYDIEINKKTGEIYFATAKGLISYKGTATEPQSDFSDIFVYPNPVKPGYNGVIAIRGLVKDTDVRITDISGNIVYETTSLGGQAIWDGNDFNGNRVQSGVYMVFNGSQNGELKAATKILFLN